MNCCLIDQYFGAAKDSYQGASEIAAVADG